MPIHDASGTLHSLQFIGAGGTTRFLKGGLIAGLYFLIGNAGKVVCVAEGYATAWAQTRSCETSPCST